MQCGKPRAPAGRSHGAPRRRWGGRFAQAEQMLARLAGERPDNLRVRLDSAAALFTLGRDDEAGELFRPLPLVLQGSCGGRS